LFLHTFYHVESAGGSLADHAALPQRLDGLGPEIFQADFEKVAFGVWQFDGRIWTESLLVLKIPHNCAGRAPDAPTHDYLRKKINADEEDHPNNDLNRFGHADPLSLP
jgi:hypothetical protein